MSASDKIDNSHHGKSCFTVAMMTEFPLLLWVTNQTNKKAEHHILWLTFRPQFEHHFLGLTPSVLCWPAQWALWGTLLLNEMLGKGWLVLF